MFPQLKVVIWKNYVLRKRHWLLTIIESLLPILLFFLIAYGRSKIDGLNKKEVSNSTYSDPQPIHYGSLGVHEIQVLFTHYDNEFYDDIMSRVQIKFQIYNNNIKGFVSEQELLKYYASHHDGDTIAIIFNGNDEKKLDYVIRYHDGSVSEDMDTSKLYKSKFNFHPSTGTGYYWKGLLALQTALDMSFIEKMYGKDLEDNATIFVQEFPYPPHKDDSAITVLFMTYLPMITIFSFMFLCPAVLKRVVEEKHSGIKELMKMVGMKPWMLWLGWFIYGIVPMLVSISFITILMKVPFFGSDYPPIEYTNGCLLFIFLLLYCTAAIVFCFAISSLFSKPDIAMVTGILIWILSYFIPKYSFGLEESNAKLSWISSVLLNLLPNMAMHFGFSVISSYEERELGIQWNNFYKSSSGGSDDVTMLNVFVMLVVDIMFYMCFTIYMDGVNPGEYGVRKPWHFPIRPLIKMIRVSPIKGEMQEDCEAAQLSDMEEGHGLRKGIEIMHLRKRFGHKMAVDNLKLDIYQNQITVLLGQNGAGKTTTMSMITGMIDPTSGTILMNGMDIRNNLDDIRKTLGLCPQHNLLFTDLTVGEHLQFFARLKGRSANEATQEMRKILKKLNLSDKENNMACTLSGGMKRKLCLGMAIIGGSNILILDEPTSGMDPESRRELWDLLLEWRTQKTILITTHFMEEADVLGDWIAIMANGRLQDYGTPLNLKKKYDTGYHLSLMVSGSATTEDREEIKRMITTLIEDAQFKDSNGNNMVFVLPFEDNLKIANLLSYLEERKDVLKIENISVTITTLEDVFLKAKMAVETEPDNTATLEDTAHRSQRLLMLRVKALITKVTHFYRKKYINYLIPVGIAVIFFSLTAYLSTHSNGYYGDNGPELKLQLNNYKQTLAFYNITKNDGIEKYYKDIIEASGSTAVNVKDVEKAIIDKGIENIVYYQDHMIVGAEFRYTSGFEVIALYNAMALHSSPISLNLVTNVLAKAFLGEEYSISASIWPLETISSQTSKEYSVMVIRILWLIMIPIGCLFIIGSFIMFPHIELSTKFTQLQYMCGVNPFIYWVVNFCADLLFYAVIVMGMAFLTIGFTPFMTWKEWGPLFVILLMYGLAGIPFAYIFSRQKSASAGFALFVILGIFFGIILTVIIGVLEESMDDSYIYTGKVLKVIFMLLLPQFGFTYSAVQFSTTSVRNYNMKITADVVRRAMCTYKPNPCCFGENTSECQKYLSHWHALTLNFLLMSVSCIMYLLLNVFLDSYFLKKCVSRFQYKVHQIKNRGKDKMNYLSDMKDSTAIKYNTLNAEHLSKTYSGKQIVKNICFTLNDGQCLGILGVNGAGKTTTFRMLTRDEVVDEGNVKIEDKEGNRFIDIQQDEYLQNLGYCPQGDALNFVLTGREILTLIAELRGIENSKTVVDLFLEMFELEKYADTPCSQYSGGNKRKLSLAVALIGYPKYVLLDEPTNGVDPFSRRKFWNLIKSIQEKKKLSFLLTSHSMVECEALCNDLKIMKDGKFEKEGTISELKKGFGGFSIKLKLRNKNKFTSNDTDINGVESYDEVDSAPLIRKDIVPRFANHEDLRNYFVTEYNSEIKDEHSGLLHVQTKDKNKRWSTLFKEIESIKTNNDHLIEDYAISEASLEDVFLSVARSEKSGDNETRTEKKKSKKKRDKERLNTV